LYSTPNTQKLPFNENDAPSAATTANGCIAKKPKKGIDTSRRALAKRECIMAQWNLKPWQIFVLGVVALAMLLIIVIPDDIDLPATAFHRNTGPTAVHAQATAAPAMVMVATIHLFPTAAEAYPPFYQAGDLASSPDPNSVPILLKTIRR
jgi:hypothetical protein